MNHLPDEVLQQLADAQLAGEALAQAEGHLEGCPHCRGVLAEYREIFGGLEALPLPPPPPRFTAQVMARVDARERERSRQRRQAAAMLGGSALLALTCFLLAGNGAWARQLTNLSTTALQLGRLGHVVGGALLPVLEAWRLPLLAIAAAVCLPTLMALHRSLAPRAQAV
jgi:hypothetical protein